MPFLDPSAVVLAGVALIPLIISLIQVLKRLAPHAPGNLWLGMALGLGVAGQCLAQVAESGAPSDLSGWLALAVLGLMTGLAAAKAYDESIGQGGLAPLAWDEVRARAEARLRREP